MLNSIRDYLAQALLLVGPWGLFFAGVLDSAFVPLAQLVDVLIIAQAAIAPHAAYAGASLAVAGSTLGSLMLYLIARRGGRSLREKSASSARVAKVRQQLEKYDALALLLPTMIPMPLPMRPLVIAAGIFKMNIGRFLGVIAVARAVRYLGIAYLAVNYGETTLALLQQHGLAGLALAAGIAAVFVAVRIWRAKRTVPAPTLELPAPETESA